MIAVGQVSGHLAVGHGRTGRRQERSGRLGQLAGRRSQSLVPVFAHLGARRLRIGKQHPVTVGVVFFHAREPVQPSASQGAVEASDAAAATRSGSSAAQASGSGPPPEMPHIASRPVFSAAQIALTSPAQPAMLYPGQGAERPYPGRS
jgi:hypothetical protein